MGKVIYKVCQWLRERKLLPWFIWSPVFDHFHGLFEEGKQWSRTKKHKG